jgi:hypothetical protein
MRLSSFLHYKLEQMLSLKIMSWCRRLPPHATTAVRCELLPLTSGIITLDTLHIATNEHGNSSTSLASMLPRTFSW